MTGSWRGGRDRLRRALDATVRYESDAKTLSLHPQIGDLANSRRVSSRLPNRKLTIGVKQNAISSE